MTPQLTISYSIATGAAQTISGTDYTALTRTATIAARATFVDVVVAPLDDSTVEGDEAVSLTLTDGTAYNLGTQTSATVTIADNDQAVVIDQTLTGSEGANTLTGGRGQRHAAGTR